jgi:hypothetical protein
MMIAGVSLFVIVPFLSLLTGCDPAVTAALDTALGKLVSNKNLSEQFVRDIKATIEPTDSVYGQLMDRYEDSKDSYNHLLDSVEKAARTNRSSPSVDEALERAQTSSAEFLAQATRSLRPDLNTRGIAFERAISVPEGLPESLHKLPGKYRNRLIDQFDKQIRWRSWRQI